VAIAASAVTPSISYQGSLTDSAGNPLSGTYTIAFKLYDVSSGGTSLDTDTHSVEVTDGLFNTEIDFDQSYFDGRELWLGIAVGEDAEMTPRQELRPVPYALSLRPGAVINGSLTGPVLKVENTGWVGEGVVAATSGDWSNGFGASTSGEYSTVFHGTTSGDNSGGVYVKTTGDNSDGYEIYTYGDGSCGFDGVTKGDNSYGVHVYTYGDHSDGIYAHSDKGNGVIGVSETGEGVKGTNGNTGNHGGLGGSWYGVYGRHASTKNYGALGRSTPNCGVYGATITGSDGHAGYFTTATGERLGGATVYAHNSNSHGIALYARNDASDDVTAAFINMGTGYLIKGFGGDGGEHDFAVHNDGKVTTPVLQITGGSDLSEQFEVHGIEADLLPSPGMVVSIDPESPGDLIVSNNAYDRRVAGIISGAGGLKPGMLMCQKGSEADGTNPVALTGRVYCWADASNSPIEPGDMLTTSDTPGHAMKVTDYTRAQGAVIGKAMSSLDEGHGLVLVLVTLQ